MGKKRAAAAATEGAESVDVVTNKGRRTFSLAVHGEAWHQNAEDFAAKHGGKIVASE